MANDEMARYRAGGSTVDRSPESVPDPWAEAKEKRRIERECMDREARRIMALSPGELDDWLRSQGVDPADAVKQVDDAIDRALRQCGMKR